MKNIVHNLKRKISIFLEIFDSVLSTHKSCLCTRAYISIRYDIWYVKRQYNHTNEICVHLTDISDTLSRDVKKLSNENRLSRNLKNFDFEKTKDIEINLYKKVLPDKETTIIIDGSDIANTQILFVCPKAKLWNTFLWLQMALRNIRLCMAIIQTI